MAPQHLDAKTGAAVMANGAKQQPEHFDVAASPRLFDGRGQDVIPMYRNCPYLLYLDWMWRPWKYFDTAAHGVSFLAAWGFLMGGLLFGVGTFGAVTPAIFNTQVIGNCMGDVDDWLVNFPYLFGDSFWAVAVICQCIEALNSGFDKRVFDWEMSGRQGPKPKYHWIGFTFSLEMGGALSYTIGVGQYWTAALVTILNDCPATTLAPLVYFWLIDIWYIIAGFLFFLAGLLYLMSEVSVYVYPGIFCPLNRKDAKSVRWWAFWTYFWGGVGFALGGIQLNWFSPFNTTEPLADYNIVDALGYGGGSILFAVGAGLLLSRQSRGRCRPSYMMAGRLDPTIQVGPNFVNGKPDPASDEKV